jgi:hypothetical protein
MLNRNNIKISGSILLAALAFGSSACGGDKKEPKAPEPDTSEEIKEAGEAVGDEVEGAAEDAAEGASDAADEVSEELDQEPETDDDD